MKLQVKSSREFNAMLQKLAKCIPSKPLNAVLENALLTMNEDGRFFLMSSTGDSQLTIPVQLSVVHGKFGKSVAMPVKIISAFLATLPDCVVTFDFVDGTNTVQLEYCTGEGDKVKEGKAMFTFLESDGFPIMQKPSGECLRIALPSSTFLSIVDKCGSFVDNDEFHPQMACVCMDVVEDMSEVVFVGTNGHTLFKHNYSNDPARGGSDFFRGGPPAKILLFNQYFRTLSVFDGCGVIEVESNGNTIRLSSGDIEFVCKGIEQKYPNYNSVIPKGNPYHVCFDKKEMLSVIKRMKLFSNGSSGLIVLSKSGMFLTMSANDVYFGRGAEDQVIISDSECVDGFIIGFNAEALLTAIGTINSDNVRMQLSAPSRPCLITADEPSPKTLVLVMPMQI